MQTIEQLRKDTRPLLRLDTASIIANEPLGNLLTRLAAKDTPLLVQRPPEARIYCVTRTDTIFKKYPESILDLSDTHLLTGGRKPRRGATEVEANHFSYLVLMAYEYINLLDGEIALFINYFRQAAIFNKSESRLDFVDAALYIRDRIPDLFLLKFLEGKFACYTNNEEWPGAFSLRALKVKPEELLISRASLLDLIENKDMPSEAFPPELKEHLQPWKSEFLRAMNIAAYGLYAQCKKIEIQNSNISSSSIKETIASHLSSKTESDTKISLAATLLRHDHGQLEAKRHLDQEKINHYPSHFSYRLIFLNEKCREYKEDYLKNSKARPQKSSTIENDLSENGVIPKNTARRIAGEIKPDYEEINHPEK
nr:hypothetical protein [uncultured Halomonas sp.]